MILVAHELLTSQSLSQKITIGEKPLMVEHIRPHLYKALSPSGSLQIQVWDSNQKVVASSSAVAISSISAANYFHGEVRFDISVNLRANASYYVSLVSTGYTYSSTDFIGWITDYDLRKVSLASGLLGDATHSPLLLELWTRQQISEGNYYG